MGTNYYWKPNTQPCPTCGHNDDNSIHIGKSSGGWKFHFHGTEELRSWADWQAKISSGGFIEDEYGGVISLDDLRRVVTVRGNSPLDQITYYKEHYPTYEPSIWRDDDGHVFSEGEFS